MHTGAVQPGAGIKHSVLHVWILLMGDPPSQRLMRRDKGDTFSLMLSIRQLSDYPPFLSFLPSNSPLSLLGGLIPVPVPFFPAPDHDLAVVTAAVCMCR